MAMHDPPHPGEFIREVYLEPHALTGRQLASKLCVSPSTLNRIMQGRSGISPEMALRLSKALGRSPESWLAMQDNYELWHARKSVDLGSVEEIEFRADQTGASSGSIEHYSDEQIARWDQEDQLSDAERSRILARLQNR